LRVPCSSPHEVIGTWPVEFYWFATFFSFVCRCRRTKAGSLAVCTAVEVYVFRLPAWPVVGLVVSCLACAAQLIPPTLPLGSPCSAWQRVLICLSSILRRHPPTCSALLPRTHVDLEVVWLCVHSFLPRFCSGSCCVARAHLFLLGQMKCLALLVGAVLLLALAGSADAAATFSGPTFVSCGKSRSVAAFERVHFFMSAFRLCLRCVRCVVDRNDVTLVSTRRYVC
jgi:hypothetical protein